MDTAHGECEKQEDAMFAGKDNDQSDTDSIALLAGEDVRFNRKNNWSKASLMHWVGHFISIIALVGLALSKSRPTNLDRSQCFELFNWWSPLNHAISQTPFVNQRFNGSLWVKNAFKGLPPKEASSAWDEATKWGMFRLSDADLHELQSLGQSIDLTPERAARYPPELGGGYVATTIGAHQLHCLRNLWMDHHIDEFEIVQKKKKVVPEMYELHYEHCVDFIRQSLMCHYDPGVITYNWVRDVQEPTPNANVEHKCIDMGPVNEWLAERAVYAPKGFTWRQPDDAYSMPHHPS